MSCPILGVVVPELHVNVGIALFIEDITRCNAVCTKFSEVTLFSIGFLVVHFSFVLCLVVVLPISEMQERF